MTNEEPISKLKAAEDDVKRLEKSNPFSEDLANALDVYAWILRTQNRLLDAANMKARADAIRSKVKPPPPPAAPTPPPPKVIVRKYVGNETQATSAFQDDAPKMAAYNYFPTSQVWAPGSYGFGMFLIALLLVFFVIGILVFIYMLLVKPSGTLTVTYELRVSAEPLNERICPNCAETIKAAAILCRFCNRNVDPIEPTVNPIKPAAQPVLSTTVNAKKVAAELAKSGSLRERPVDLFIVVAVLLFVLYLVLKSLSSIITTTGGG